MATSYTGKINTHGEFIDLGEETEITFTSGNTYSIQIVGMGYLKVQDAEFPIFTNDPFTYTASSDTVYFKTEENRSCQVIILENA